MKMLIALSLMLSMLAFGNTAAAGPFGVSMGDPIKPTEGWTAQGFVTEAREYKGTLPFEAIFIEGTRKGGACLVRLNGVTSSRESALSEYAVLRKMLIGKYGKPGKEEPEAGWFGGRASSENPGTWWFLESNRTRFERFLFGLLNGPILITT